MTTTSPTVVFGRNALTTKLDATFTSTDVQPFVDLDDLKSGAISKPYATYEPDYWLLDGNFKFMPAQPHMGYMSLRMSNSSGVLVGSAVILEITFSEVHSTTDGLVLHFSKLSGDYISQFRIYYYNGSDVLIRNDTYNPTAPDFSINQAVTDFKRIEIRFDITSRPFRYARLVGIDFDELITFAGSEIKSAQLVEQIDPICLELPFNTVDITLFSSEAAFSIVNPTGFYASLQYREPLDVYEQIDDETIYIGRFYLDTWDSKSENEATFRAIDALGVMDANTWIGGYFDTGATGDLAPDVLGDLFTAADIDYELNSFWNTFGLTGWVPIGSFRDGLKDILFALFGGTQLQAVATCARSSVVRILSLQIAKALTSYEFTILSSEQKLGASLTLKPLVTAVEVDGMVWTRSSATIEIFNATLATGTHVITISDPPMDTYGITGATILSSGANFVELSVAATGTVVLSGKKLIPIPQTYTLVDSAIGAEVKPNIISIKNAYMIASNLPGGKADRILTYFQGRYKLETILFAPLAAVGNSVLVDVQGGRQLGGYIERMETDLAGGMIAKTTIVGIIVPV